MGSIRHLVCMAGEKQCRAGGTSRTAAVWKTCSGRCKFSWRPGIDPGTPLASQEWAWSRVNCTVRSRIRAQLEEGEE